MKILFCPRCGHKLDGESFAFCPKCGTKLMDNDVESSSIKENDYSYEKSNLGTSDRVDNTDFLDVKSVVSAKAGAIQNKKTYLIPIIAVLLIIAIVLSVVVQNNKKKALRDYASAYYIAGESMLWGMSKSEECCNLVSSVWNNAIFNIDDTSTNKYTKPKGYWVDNFNVALANLYSDNEFLSDVDFVRKSQEAVDTVMDELHNPPAGYEKAYDVLCDCYVVFKKFTNLAISQDGMSYNSFSDEFAKVDQQAADYYAKVKLYYDKDLLDSLQ